jgi:hypothetical protein
MSTRIRLLGLIGLLVLATLQPASAHPLPEPIEVDAGAVRVTMRGDRRVPIVLADDAVLDLTPDAAGRPAGVNIHVEEGADLAFAEYGFGVAIVERGAADGIVVAAMFGEDLRPMLVHGQQSRLGLARPVTDAVTCSRCALPAGAYDLIAFGGPWSADDDEPSVHVDLALEGLTGEPQHIGPAVGIPEFVLSTADHEAAANGSFGGWTLLFVFWLGDPIGPQDGIMLTEARVPATSAGPSVTSIRGRGTRLNQDELPATGEPAPHADGYDADAAATAGGSSIAAASTSAFRSFDPDENALFHGYDATATGTNAVTLDTAMLWLPISPVLADEDDLESALIHPVVSRR